MAATKTNDKTLLRDFIEKAEARMQELRPLIEEYRELEEALQGVGHSTTRPRRGGGRRRNGGRAQEFLTLVREKPGISVADAAKVMQINPNYLYRVAGDLAKRGEVEKDGQGYKVVAGAAQDSDES